MRYDFFLDRSEDRENPQTAANERRSANCVFLTSLLPALRGAAPMPHALMDGRATETGVSVAELHPRRMDAGGILAQERVPVALEDTLPVLTERCAAVGARLLRQVLETWESEGYDGGAQAQEEALATPAPRISAGDARLRFGGAEGALGAWGRFRAVAGMRRAWTRLPSGARVNVVDMAVPGSGEAAAAAEAGLGDRPGDAALSLEGELLVRAADGGVVAVLALQHEGKSVVSPRDFWNGYGQQGLRFEAVH